jgi:hypothetical protein
MCLPAVAQEAAPQHEEKKPWAEKMFASRSHDFGIVPRGLRMSHRFEVTNPYSVPLDLSNFRASMSPMVGRCTPETIPPGGRAVLEVTIDTSRFTGRKTMRGYVTITGKEYLSQTYVEISATSRDELAFTASAIDFGMVEQGNTDERSLDVGYTGKLDWRITEIVNDDPRFSAEINKRNLAEVPGTAKKMCYQLKVIFRADQTAGDVDHRIVLKTNHPEMPTIAVPVTATVGKKMPTKE